MAIEIGQPLPLKGTCNTRDLGGYPTQDGSRTRWGFALRSDSLHGIEEADFTYLKEYGIKTVIDLRSEEECRRQPTRLARTSGIQYFHIPLLDEMHSSQFSGKFPDSLGELYIRLLEDSGPQIGKVLRTIHDQEGALIFNCTAGKDRTGLIAMLLLDLAGVPQEEIVSDYTSSAVNMEPIFSAQKRHLHALGYEFPTHAFTSSPEDIQSAIDHIYTRWGGAKEYILSLGLSIHEIQRLRLKMREDFNE